jgi:hypothetical protein
VGTWPLVGRDNRYLPPLVPMLVTTIFSPCKGQQVHNAMILVAVLSRLRSGITS